MKSLLLILLFIIQASTLFSQEDAMQNYNGDFEAGTMDYWRFAEVAGITSGSYAEITDSSFTGNYATQVTWKAGGVGMVELVLDNWSSRVEVVEGQSYTINAAVMATEDVGLRLHISLGFFNSAGSVINESTVDWGLSSSYVVKQHTGLAPPGAVNCWIAFRLFGSTTRWPESTGITLIDDVQLWTEPIVPNSIENNTENYLNVFPNPVSTLLRIESSDHIENVSIYDMQGQLIKIVSDNFDNIYCGNIVSGMYILKIIGEEKNIIRTIIKD